MKKLVNTAIRVFFPELPLMAVVLGGLWFAQTFAR